MHHIRVMIVDDSQTIRQLIRARLRDDPRVEVVGEAADPIEAREKIKALVPDILTLDVEMPRMNGLEFLEKLMRLRPMPVVMISSETQRGSSAALDALALGAVECIGKPTGGMLHDSFADLADTLVAAAGARLKRAGSGALATAKTAPFFWNGRHVLIGSSTGGVDALETVLRGYPANCPPTLITQHMPAAFLASLATRLNSRIAPHLQLAEDGMVVAPGNVYLAPGGDVHLQIKVGSPARCRLVAGEKRSGHLPSVDVLMESAVPMAKKCIGVILTGMGRDGAEGMRALRDNGGRCFAQDEATSVVFGMPKVALELGGAEKAVPLKAVAQEILALAGGTTAVTASKRSTER